MTPAGTPASGLYKPLPVSRKTRPLPGSWQLLSLPPGLCRHWRGKHSGLLALFDLSARINPAFEPAEVANVWVTHILQLFAKEGGTSSRRAIRYDLLGTVKGRIMQR